MPLTLTILLMTPLASSNYLVVMGILVLFMLVAAFSIKSFKQ